MNNLPIIQFKECQQCGECCGTPCDIIPSDLPPLLERFQMNLADFYKRYLIALIIKSPKYTGEILMMVPVRVNSQGVRYPKYLADKEYLDNCRGNCIFLRDNKCSIHDIKPYGGKFLKCARMTESAPIDLGKSQCFGYWYNNQHLFEIVFPGYTEIYRDIKENFRQMAQYINTGRQQDADRLWQPLRDIISNRLFPLFNGSPPVNGWATLWEKQG